MDPTSEWKSDVPRGCEIELAARCKRMNSDLGLTAVLTHLNGPDNMGSGWKC